MKITILLAVPTLLSICHAVEPVPAATADSAAAKLSKPTPDQANWQDDEIGMFFHMDLPIFTDGGKGNGANWKDCGKLDPNLFNPARLNTDQWLEAAKAIGAKHTVFVAKHNSGFILWQSDAYPYGLRQSKWRDGKGDILRDYVASCKKAGILPGIYVSWPSNAYWGVMNGKVNFGKGGDEGKLTAYTKAYERLLTEAYGNYGPFCEIWFDGGLLPRDKGGPDAAGILTKFQPHAVAFQGPTANSIRWVGNEKGIAPYPCWATGFGGSGSPDASQWQPAECDVPVRNHEWFWQPNSDHKLFSLDQLMEIYYNSVGHNADLILNANPDRDGLIPMADMQRYREFGAEIKRRFGKSVAGTSGEGEVIVLDLGKPTKIDHVILMEEFRHGERVREFTVEGRIGDVWKPIFTGQSIGHKLIRQFDPVEVSQVRLRVTKSAARPLIKRLAVFDVADLPPLDLTALRGDQ